MRIGSFLAVSFVAVFIVGAASAFVGTQTQSLAIGAAVVGLVSTAGIAYWATSKIYRDLHLLDEVLNDRRLRVQPGFKEFRAMVESGQEALAGSKEALAQAREQTREVEQLLEVIERRVATGSDGDLSPAHQLRGLLSNLTQKANTDLGQVVGCSGEIANRIGEILSNAQEQANAVSQTTTFVEQMSDNIDSVSQNAEAAHKAAEEARESAAVGQDLVRDLIRGMDRIRLHVEAGKRKLRSLGDRSQEIGSIVELIGTVSARTDMLALNAAIESVRAGEHGRGFAVVAEEVRKLAEQAAQATREVGGLIESMQLETQESIAAMADEHGQVETELQRVNDAGGALERISQTSNDSAQRVGDISRATLHQLRLTQEVVMAMDRISELAQGIRSGAERVSGTTDSLAELANELDSSLAPLRFEQQSKAASMPGRGPLVAGSAK